jgi:type I restriction enzyme S subunit
MNIQKFSFLPMKFVEELSGRTHLTETRKYGNVKKGYTSFVNGDILFAKVTPCMENGKIAAVDNLKNSVGFGSSEFHVIRPQKGIPEGKGKKVSTSKYDS